MSSEPTENSRVKALLTKILDAAATEIGKRIVGIVFGIFSLPIFYLAFIGNITDIFKHEDGPIADNERDCFHVNMESPKTVLLNKWPSMEIKLTGENNCSQKLAVHIAYKTAQLDRVTFESPVAPCLAPANPDCWQQQNIDPGPVDMKLLPPVLRVHKNPLGEPVDININWVVFSIDTKKQLAARIATITLEDPPET